MLPVPRWLCCHPAVDGQSAVMGTIRLNTPTVALWRSAGVLQLGLDSPALVLAGVPAELEQVVELLHHPTTSTELHHSVPGLAPDWVDWLIAQLDTAGILDTSDEPRAARIRLLGDAELAEHLQFRLTAAGLDTQLRVAHPGRLPPDPWPGLTVIASATAEPDRLLTQSLIRANQPHLVVRLEPGRAVVGPMVLPGLTPCVHCLDLTQRDLDRHWPILLAQLCNLRVDPDPVLLEWAVSTATIQIRAWSQGRLPETASGCLEVTQPGHQLGFRRWTVHPECGCQAN